MLILVLSASFDAKRVWNGSKKRKRVYKCFLEFYFLHPFPAWEAPFDPKKFNFFVPTVKISPSPAPIFRMWWISTDKKNIFQLYCLCYKETIIKGMPSFYTGSNVQYIRVPDGIFLFELRKYHALNVLGLFLYFTLVSFDQKFSLR